MPQILSTSAEAVANAIDDLFGMDHRSNELGPYWGWVGTGEPGVQLREVLTAGYIEVSYLSVLIATFHAQDTPETAIVAFVKAMLEQQADDEENE